MMIKALLLFTLTTHASVVSHWLLPNTGKIEFETSAERTQPVVVGDAVYAAGVHSNVYSIHRTLGYAIWTKKMEAPVEGSLSYGRSKLVVGDLKGNLVALNARDGSENWRFKIQGEWLSPASIYRDKVIATTSGDEMYAFSEAKGVELWHYSHRGDEKMTVRGTSGPVVFGSDVFQGFSDGHLVALNVNDGKVIWDKRLKTKTRFTDVDMNVYADSTSVIAGTFDGKVFSLDRTTGNTIWMFPVGSYGGFAVENNKVYFSGLDGNFYALDRNTGGVVWKTSFVGGVGTTPALVDGFVVISTSEDPVYVLDAATGKVHDTVSLGRGTLASVAAGVDGWFYVMSNYSNLFSYQINKNLKSKKGPEVVPHTSAVERDIVLPKTNNQVSG